MTKTTRTKIGLRDLKALAPHSQLLDTAVVGFRARRQSGAAVTFSVCYRADGRQRRATIGRWGQPWTPAAARQKALKLLGEVADGADPARNKQARREAPTMAELFDVYLSEARAGRIIGRAGRPKRASTIAFDEGAIRAHLAPLLGDRKVSDVTRQDVEAAMHGIAEGRTARNIKGRLRGLGRVTGGRGVASRVMGLLGGVFSFAVARGLRKDNPCSRLRRFAGEPRDRRLSDNEFAALATALQRTSVGGAWPPAIACLRFLSLTGWRSGEGPVASLARP